MNPMTGNKLSTLSRNRNVLNMASDAQDEVTKLRAAAAKAREEAAELEKVRIIWENAFFIAIWNAMLAALSLLECFIANPLFPPLTIGNGQKGNT